MKKFIAAILCVLLMAGCASETDNQDPSNDGQNIEQTEQTDGGTGMGGGLGVANPVVSYETAEEVESVTEVLLNVPENAEEVKFSAINGTTAQAKFVLDGVEYTLRASKQAPTASLHGIYADVVSTEGFATASGLTVTSSNLGDQYSVCEWENNGTFFSISREGVENMSVVVEMITSIVE